MIKLSIIPKIILALGTIALAVRAFTYEPHGGYVDRRLRIALPETPNLGVILQCVVIIIITIILIILVQKSSDKK